MLQQQRKHLQRLLLQLNSDAFLTQFSRLAIQFEDPELRSRPFLIDTRQGCCPESES